MTRDDKAQPLQPSRTIGGVRYFSSTAVTKDLRVSRQTLWRWRKEGSIPPGHRFRDRQVFFTQDEVDEIRLFAYRIEPATAEIYLDNNATTPVLPEVREAMVEAMGAAFGNASSVHEAGERGRAHLRHAREKVAALLGVAPPSLVFTSGATEANNLVLLSTLSRGHPPHVVTTTIEHSSILSCCEHLETLGAQVTYLPVDENGLVSLEALKTTVTHSTNLVSVQWVNNETGVIQPIKALGSVCRDLNVPFHVDAAQAAGKFELGVEDLPIDYLSVSGHKLHAPPGVGALYARDRDWLTPLVFGGSQEGGLRAGTENVPGIAGLGRAAEIRAGRLEATSAHLSELRDRFECLIRERLPGVRRNGGEERRVSNTSNLLFEGVDGQALVARLDQAGIRCSQSSACTNMRPEPSYVLRAMGLTEAEAYASVRFSFSELNTMQDVESAADEVVRVALQIRQFRQGLQALSA